MVGKQQRAKAIDCPRNEDTCDVTYLVQKGAHLRRCIPKRGKGWHEDVIEIDPVVRIVSAFGDRNLQGCHESLGMFEPLALGQDRDREGLISLDLCEVENREGPGEHAGRTGLVVAMIVTGR